MTDSLSSKPHLIPCLLKIAFDVIVSRVSGEGPVQVWRLATLVGVETRFRPGSGTAAVNV